MARANFPGKPRSGDHGGLPRGPAVVLLALAALGAALVSGPAAASNLVNDGFRITVSSGTILTVGGNYFNRTASGADGTMTNSGEVRVAGGWANQAAGALTVGGTGTVKLTGSDQAVSGSTAFYDLVKTVSAAATLSFANGAANETVVTHAMTLQGAAGQLLSLRSDSDGVQWYLKPQGTVTIGYLDVKDSRNTNGGYIGAANKNCVDSGNTANWIFVPPSVSDARISVSGASGSGGAFRAGDTVTATWDNTALGDNNAYISTVTVDFSQFGGGAAQAATNSGGTWSASYAIPAGAIDSTNRNVSVTATDAAGVSTTTADTTGATVDNQSPVVTDASVSISGATGTAGVYRAGDTVTAVWNDTAGGDDNPDTIASVTVDFSQFGGGAAVAATNSGGTWSASYTITAGAIDAVGRNVSVTATDNAGNPTTTADTTGATVDSQAPGTPSGTLAVNEMSLNGTAAGTVSGGGADGVTYALTGDAGGRFACSAAGSVTVAGGSLLDFEAASSHSITVRATDNAGNATDGTIPVTVNDVNDPPVLATNTGVTVFEGQAGTITAAMLAEGDQDDSGNELTYLITAVPTKGFLWLDGNGSGSFDGGEWVQQVGDSFTQGDIDMNHLKYTHGGSEDHTDGFTFSLRDGLEDGVAELTGQTFAITVTPVNDPPAISGLDGESFTYVMSTGARLVNQGAAASVSDSDSADFNGGTLSVWVNAVNKVASEDQLSLDTTGTVSLAGTAAGSVVSVGGNPVGTLGSTIQVGNDLDVLLNTVDATPAAVADLINAVTYQNLDIATATENVRTIIFKLDDGDGNANGGSNLSADFSVSIAVTRNVLPLLSLAGPALSFTENGAALAIDPAALASDPDGDADWNGGRLEVQITVNAEAGDEISIPDNAVGTINTYGTDLRDGATVIGTLTASTGTGAEGTVTSNTKLTMTFNASATNALVQQAVRAIHYRSASENPGTSTRTVTLTLTDRMGGQAVDTRTVEVTAVNDPPAAGFGRALAFDGVDGRVTVPDGAGLDITASFSVMAWVKADAFDANGHDNSILIKEGADTTGYGLRTGNGGEVQFFVGDGSSWYTATTGPGAMDAGKWHHVAGVMTGSDMRIYVDGVSRGTGASAGSVGVNGVDLGIGWSAVNGRYFHGSIDEVSLWNRALSANEVRSYMLMVIPGGESGLAAYWRFEGATASDGSSGGNDGTLAGGVSAADFGSIDIYGTEDTPITLPNLPGWDPAEGTAVTFDLVDDDSGAAVIGTPASGALAYTPPGNVNGIRAFTYKTNDTALDSQVQTVNVHLAAVNDAPTISDIGDLGIGEDGATPALAFTVGDAETSASGLILAAASSNTAVIPDGNIALGGSDASRTVTVTPAANANGTATITVTVTDPGQDNVSGNGDDLTSQDQFVITVSAVNDVPSFIKGPDQVVNEDAGIQVVAGWATGMIAGPADESGQTLTFAVTNDNNTLFSSQPVIDATGRLTFTPSADAHGTATTSVSLKDDGGTSNGGVDTSAVQTFTITVDPVNDPPTLAEIPDPPPIDEDAAVQTVLLSGMGSGAVNEPQVLTVTVSSSNPALIPDPTVTYSSPSATGTLGFTPAANASGTATITVTVRDAGLDGTSGNGDDATVSKQFTVTVNPVNDPPTIAELADLSFDENASGQTVALGGIGTGADNETQTLTVSAVSGNPSLIPDPAVTYASPSATGTLGFTPAANASGTATITVTVRDSGFDGFPGNADDAETSRDFTVTVNPFNDPPTIAAISDPPAIGEDSPEQTIALTGIGTGAPDEAQAISVTAVSSDTAIVPEPLVTYSSPDGDGTLKYTPAANAHGTVRITVTVRDAGFDGIPGNGDDAETAREFTVTVYPVNDAPVLNPAAVSNPPAISDRASDPVAVPGSILSPVPVSTILGTGSNASATDPADGTSVAGIAVTAVSAASLDAASIGMTAASAGRWQYALGGSAWTDITAASASGSLILSSGASVRYLPAPGDAGTALLKFRAWDGSSGTATVVGGDGATVTEGRADSTVNGGTTAFSASEGTLAQSVTTRTLFLDVTPLTLAEDSGTHAGAGRVLLTSPQASDLTVYLSSDRPARLGVPSHVLLKAGSTSVSFDMSALDNRLLDGSEVIRVTAFAEGTASGTDEVTVTDDETPGLRVELPPQVSERAGTITGTVIATAVPVSDLTVTLSGGRSQGGAIELALPVSVTILAGAGSAIFKAPVTDNQLTDGNRQITVDAAAPGWGGASRELTIIDDDGAAASGTISVVLPSAAVSGDGVLAGAGRVTLDAPAETDITVFLASSGTGLTVPVSVAVAAGTDNASFDLTVLSDNGPEAASAVSVWAIAAGYDSGNAVTVVFDPPSAETGTQVLERGATDQVIMLAVNSNARVTPQQVPGDAATADSSGTQPPDLFSGLKFDRVVVKVDPADLTLHQVFGAGAGKQALKAVDIYGEDLLSRGPDGTPLASVNPVSGEISFDLKTPAGLADSPTRRPVIISFTGAVGAEPAADADGAARGVLAITLTDKAKDKSCAAASGDGDMGGGIASGSLGYVVGEPVKPAVIDAFVEITPPARTVTALTRTGTLKVFVRFPATSANLDATLVSGDGVNELTVSLPPGVESTLTKVVRYAGTGAGGTGLPAGTEFARAIDFTEIEITSAPGTRRYAFAEPMKVADGAPVTVEFDYLLAMPLQNISHQVTLAASHVNRSVAPEKPGPSTMAITGDADASAGNSDKALYTQRVGTIPPTISGLILSEGAATVEGTAETVARASATEVSRACRITWTGFDPDSVYSTRLFWSLSDIDPSGVVAEIGKTPSKLSRISQDPVSDLRKSATPLESSFLWQILPLTAMAGVFSEGSTRSNPVFVYAVACDFANQPTAGGGQVLKSAGPLVIVRPAAADASPLATVVASPAHSGPFLAAAPSGPSPNGAVSTVFSVDRSAWVGVRVADDSADPVRVELFYSSNPETQRAAPCKGTDGKPVAFSAVPAVIQADSSDSAKSEILTASRPFFAQWDTTGIPFGSYLVLARVYEPGQLVVETWSSFKVGVSHQSEETVNTAPAVTWISPGIPQGVALSRPTVVTVNPATGLAPVSFKVFDAEGDPVSVVLKCNSLNIENANALTIGGAIDLSDTASGSVYSGTVDFSGVPAGAYYLLASVTETNRSLAPVKVWSAAPVIVDRSLGITDLLASVPFADPLDPASFAVNVTFRTTTPALGEVRYGSNGLPLSSVGGAGISLGHSITIHGLAAGSVYQYMVAADTDSGQSYEMDNGGKLYVLTTPATVSASSGRWVKGAVAGAPAGTVKAFVVRAGLAGASGTVSEPFTARISVDGTFFLDIDSSIEAADPSLSPPGTALPAAFTPGDGDMISIEIQLDSGSRAFFDKLSLSGISAATSQALALELPLLWNAGKGVAVVSDILDSEILLFKGYNMVSLPIEPEGSLTAEGILRLLGADAGVVAAYSPVDGVFRYVFRIGNSFLGKDFDISLTEGFFVKVTRDMPLKIRGRKTGRPVPMPVHKGYNLVGIPYGRHFPATNGTGVTAKALLTEMGIDGLAVYRYANGAYSVVARLGTDDAGSPVFHAPDGDFELKVGQGIFLKMFDQNTFMGE